VISGRSDALGCNIQQPNFAAELARDNVIFRIPTPTFGLGLVESVSDSGLEAALAANAQLKSSLGVSGRFNHSGNDGTITRFGWKAQNKSLLVFSGEAYNVEMGVTNDAFPNERETNPSCQYNDRLGRDAFDHHGRVGERQCRRRLAVCRRLLNDRSTRDQRGTVGRINGPRPTGLLQHRLWRLSRFLADHGKVAGCRAEQGDLPAVERLRAARHGNRIG